MLEFLNQGWVGSIIGTLGLIMGLVGILLYRRSRIGPRLMCQIMGLRLLGRVEQALPDEVEIRFRGKDVPRLTSSRVYLWNAGTQTIRGDQIVEDDPLRCEFGGRGEILEAGVAAYTRKHNKVQVCTAESHSNRAVVSFDYLDPGDGARIDLLHTNQDRDPRVCGSVRGMPQGVLTMKEASLDFVSHALSPFLPRTRKVFLTVTAILGSVSFALSVLFPKELEPEARWVFFACSVLYSFFFGLLFFLFQRKRYPLALDDRRGRMEKPRGHRILGHSSRRL